MSTATIQNIPTKIVKQYGKTIDYKELITYLNDERVKKIEKKYYNKNEDNYGPFNGAKEAISFLTRNRG